MRRRLRFPPSFRAKMAANEAALRAMSPDGKLPEAMQARFDALRPKPRKPRVPRLPTLDAPHKPLEREIQKAIIEALRLHPRVLKVVRFNSGGSMHRGANGKEYLVMFSSEPVPDLFVLLRGGFAWLEVKRPGWRQPTDEREMRQSRFLATVREAGGIGCFVRSVDEALEAISS